MKSKYQIVLDDITTLIENNAYCPGSMLPTEKELAAHYGVSRSTIQKTLGTLVLKGMITRTAGKGTFVTERPVLEEGLPGRDDVVILLPNHQTQVSFGYLRGASSRLKQEGIQVTPHYSHNNSDQVFLRARQYAQGGAAGLIVYPISSEDPEGVLVKCRKSGLPVVTIDKNTMGATLSSVCSDNYAGGFIAGTHLIEKGHRDILWVQNEQLSDTLQDRMCGFVDALAERGLSLPEENRFVFAASNDHKSKETIMSFLRKRVAGAPPTAVFCASDAVASLVYRAAYDLGIKIPDVLSVIGFDNLDIAEAMSPPMTTIAQDFYAIGKEAANLLLEQIRGGTGVTKRYLPVELIERESVRDLSGSRRADAEPREDERNIG
ncbi:MAG TPA: GntR family transcriptional regulator [Clostridia bacterium]|nr:GntR family transcriptional regulator [Clostridia bacterium]